MGVAGMGVAGMGIAGMGIAGMGGVGGMAGAGGDSACNEGDTRHCYTGKVGTEGVGVCHGGTETCSSGAFGACLDEVAPSKEMYNMLDDDCNGLVDECNVEEQADLKGECLIGKLTDENGVVVCKQVNFPVAEKCKEGKDTNCDGAWGIPPTEAVTACPLDPSKTCLGGKWACVGPDGDQYVQCVAGEKCDGVDDNCNGTVDEMCI